MASLKKYGEKERDTMKEETIQYIGANELTVMERRRLDKLATGYHSKIQRMLKNMTSLVVHVKIYESAGKGKKEDEKKRRKYAIHVRVIAPTRMFASTKAHDWDLARAVHKSFNEVQNIIAKSMHSSEQRPRRVSKVVMRNLGIE